MRLRVIFLTSALLVGLGLCGYAWLRFVVHPKQAVCTYCLRPLKANVRVIAEIAGKRAEVCCARCAITEANQQQKSLRLIEVHDYLTGAALTPGQAWFVEGNQVTTCSRNEMRMDEMKETQTRQFDRCSPGTVAFANKAEADSFAERNGGAVVSYAALMREVRFQ